ncbi:oligopeptide ABC transporter permease [Paenibacillus turpanensis]|uniref:oligopeptide ABC transporter permease n=1 Tax=Paenibacillus turpanensis TaxID=2689078 RepID=UPI00140D9C2C|nr:oligopeptide ABC transporter permease [Paenibacillus turpanensis]
MNTAVTNPLPAVSLPHPQHGNRAWGRFKKNRMAVISMIILLGIIILALLAPFIAPYDPSEQDLLNRLKPPSAEHWFGTDDLGRDLFTRVLYGARVSLSVGIFSVLFNVVIGIAVGAVAGYYGGRVDSILMRFVDVMLAFPQFFLLITVVTLLKPSLLNIIIVLTAFGWMGKARLLRGEILSVKNREYIDAARSMGLSDRRIIFFHVLPNAMAPVIVAAAMNMGTMILTESGLSFLGLGIQPPTASWGNLLQSAQSMKIMVEAPWYPVFPGMMIFITIMCFNFLGDGLRNAFDSK